MVNHDNQTGNCTEMCSAEGVACEDHGQGCGEPECGSIEQGEHGHRHGALIDHDQRKDSDAQDEAENRGRAWTGAV